MSSLFTARTRYLLVATSLALSAPLATASDLGLQGKVTAIAAASPSDLSSRAEGVSAGAQARAEDDMSRCLRLASSDKSSGARMGCLVVNGKPKEVDYNDIYGFHVTVSHTDEKGRLHVLGQMTQATPRDVPTMMRFGDEQGYPVAVAYAPGEKAPEPARDVWFMTLSLRAKSEAPDPVPGGGGDAKQIAFDVQVDAAEDDKMDPARSGTSNAHQAKSMIVGEGKSAHLAVLDYDVAIIPVHLR
ncbi:hypothetical protein F6X40_09370 [Paraburkholderia sp. UCT31]|uniref:hypothetical protein n=1 Tax=Paraburkholderia sp. UCT31 TaxID=2615209 RepID=UPI00165534C1|nr:hypothetical protein [Paraburkholderia sp. UCT31]MBC8737017.1 hypothetical protein [Paraburkholderia sp. UCT31]